MVDLFHAVFDHDGMSQWQYHHFHNKAIPAAASARYLTTHKSRNDPAHTMAQNLYRITNQGVAGGSGMVANEDIPKGKLILEDEALLVVDTGVSSAAWNNNNNNRVTAFFDAERAGRSNQIQSTLSRRLWRSKRDRFRALHDGAPNLPANNVLERNVGIVQTNCWDFQHPSINNNTWLVVGSHVSRLNHSCVPNARLSDICTQPADNLGRMRLIATTAIAADEEITVDYTQDGVWLHPRTARRQVLQQNWHFNCTCDACHAQAYRFVDATFAFAALLKNEIYADLPQPLQLHMLAKRIHAAETFVSILDFWGYGDKRLSTA
jgi:hypothetical protein